MGSTLYRDAQPRDSIDDAIDHLQKILGSMATTKCFLQWVVSANLPLLAGADHHMLARVFYVAKVSGHPVNAEELCEFLSGKLWWEASIVNVIYRFCTTINYMPMTMLATDYMDEYSEYFTQVMDDSLPIDDEIMKKLTGI